MKISCPRSLVGHGGFAYTAGRLSNGGIVQIRADENGNGVVGAYNGKGEGPELQPGP
jgi:hypothetical protein